VKARPQPEAPAAEWLEYTYTKNNDAGVQKEWWFHRSGCRAWFIAERNTVTNEVLMTARPNETGDAA